MFEKHLSSLELSAKGKRVAAFFPTRSFVSFTAMGKENLLGKAVTRTNTFTLSP
jgi:hypothetical protein